MGHNEITTNSPMPGFLPRDRLTVPERPVINLDKHKVSGKERDPCFWPFALSWWVTVGGIVEICTAVFYLENTIEDVWKGCCAPTRRSNWRGREIYIAEGAMSATAR